MRRNYAIDRMVAEKKVSVDQGEEAKKLPITLAPKRRPDELAPYFVEELRRYLESKYGTSAVHEGGLPARRLGRRRAHVEEHHDARKIVEQLLCLTS